MVICMKRAKNTFFKFKQFAVHQDQTAMKVCTEACILGAMAPVESGKHILDIGTGTGVLSLMMAQRAPQAQLDAVELDAEAFGQATFNVQNSPFAQQIRVHHQGIQEFTSGFLYDFIVSNPPFYQDSLRSDDLKRNQALHAHTLNFDELLIAINRLLHPAGKAVILLPLFEMERFLHKAQSFSLYLQNCLTIRNQPDREVFRQIGTFGRQQTFVQESALSIRNADDSYSDDFVALLKDYYLIF
ncbi:MAG: methyltransferase [Spirosomataceae bacterium]